MNPLRRLLVLVALGLLATAVVLPLRGVRTTDGHVCGSAWHAARHEIVSGPGLSVSKVELSGQCKGPGEKVLKIAAGAGGTAIVLLIGVAVTPSGRRRGPFVVAARR